MHRNSNIKSLYKNRVPVTRLGLLGPHPTPLRRYSSSAKHAIPIHPQPSIRCLRMDACKLESA